jgi:hypothetical protein
MPQSFQAKATSHQPPVDPWRIARRPFLRREQQQLLIDVLPQDVHAVSGLEKHTGSWVNLR